MATVWQIVRAFEISFITLFIGFLVSRIIGKAARRMLAEAEINKLFAAKGARSMSDIIGGSIEGILYLVTIIIVLQQIGLATVVLHAGLVLLALVAALLLFFTLREIPNLAYGLLMRKSVTRCKDLPVKVGAIEGRLESAGLLSINIVGKDAFHIPYSFAWKKLKRKR